MKLKLLVFYSIISFPLLLSTQNLVGNDTIFVSQKRSFFNIKKKALIYTSNKLEAIQLINLNAFKKRNDKKGFFYFDFDDKTIAIKIAIKNTNATSKTVFLRFSNTMIYEIEGYKSIDNQLQKIYENGIKYPFIKRVGKNRNYVIPLNLAPHEFAIFVLKIDKIEGRPLVTSINLLDEKELASKSNKEYIIVGVYVGLSLICIAISLCLFFFLKKAIYLYFLFYVLFLGLFILSYSGVFQQFLLNENVVLNKYVHYVIFSEAALVLFVVFSQKFFNAKTAQPTLYKIIKLVLITAVILRLLLHLFLSELFLAYIPIFMKFWYFLNIAGIIIVAYQAVDLYKKNKKKYFVFALAYLFMIVGAFISVLYHSYGLVDAMLWNLPILLYTSLFEIILLIVALGFIVKEFIEDKELLLGKIETQRKQNLVKFLVLKNKQKVYVSTLKYIKSEGNYLEFFSEKEKALDRNKIKEILKQLPTNFVRVHRSYIINKNYIKSVNSTFVILLPEIEIPISRTFKENING